MDIVSIFQTFPDKESCIEHLEKAIWQKGITCPYCYNKRSAPRKDNHRHHCNKCNTDFSVTVGTIFHKTRLPLQKWFLAISLILNAKKEITARQLARDIKVNKDTAWRMIMQIGKGVREHRDILDKVIEIDETYVGGKKRKIHKDK